MQEPRVIVAKQGQALPGGANARRLEATSCNPRRSARSLIETEVAVTAARRRHLDPVGAARLHFIAVGFDASELK